MRLFRRYVDHRVARCCLFRFSWQPNVEDAIFSAGDDLTVGRVEGGAADDLGVGALLVVQQGVRFEPPISL